MVAYIICFIIAYGFIGLIINRILTKFSKIHPTDIVITSYIWIVALPVMFIYISVVRGANHIIKGIDKYLDRFGTKK